MKEAILRTAAAASIAGAAFASDRGINPNALRNAVTGITSGNVLNFNGGMPSESMFGAYGVEAKATEAGFKVSGALETVDAANVEVAGGDFVNKAGGGSEMLLAEPGKLMVGWDFPQDQLEAGNGAIARIDPTNQQVFENETASFNLPEGGMVFASAAAMTVEIDGVTVELTGPGDHIWLLYVRGKYADETTPEDRNVTMKFTDYAAGHIQALRYPGVPNGGFISEEQADQQADVALESGTNCGSTGCENVSRLFYDANTQAWVAQTRDSGEWVTLDSNWAEEK